MEQSIFHLWTGSHFESHFYHTQAQVFVSECSAQENGAL